MQYYSQSNAVMLIYHCTACTSSIIKPNSFVFPIYGFTIGLVWTERKNTKVLILDRLLNKPTGHLRIQRNVNELQLLIISYIVLHLYTFSLSIHISSQTSSKHKPPRFVFIAVHVRPSLWMNRCTAPLIMQKLILCYHDERSQATGNREKSSSLNKARRQVHKGGKTYLIREVNTSRRLWRERQHVRLSTVTPSVCQPSWLWTRFKMRRKTVLSYVWCGLMGLRCSVKGYPFVTHAIMNSQHFIAQTLVIVEFRVLRVFTVMP